MGAVPKLARRYTPRDPPLGAGAMGVVYRAWDTTEGREVAVKTLKEVTDPGLLDLFRRECEVLKRLAHPNIVDILAFDFDADEPYFVMPLLEGKTLQQLIREASPRLTVPAVVDIFINICRGLQQAHDKGIVHRDLKPSNIFVLDDDSVKIIDFGVAHLVDSQKTQGQKGTLLYMSPEVLVGERPTERSDLFSLAVACYEALTLRHPFAGGSRDEIAYRIRNQSPAPAFEINPQVSFLLSQVLHAAMAKNPWLRYPSAKDFAEYLRKAIRNEPIERFDPARVEPRVEKVRRALDEGDLDTAAKVLSALEAESLIHGGIADLRRQLDDSLNSRKLRQHLESARKLFQEGELELALQETEEIRRLDPHHTEAVDLQAAIREKWAAKERHRWLALARLHIENHSWEPAREAARKVLETNSADTQAQSLMTEVDRRQNQEIHAREEKKELCRIALEEWQRGEVSSAETKLQRVVDLDRSFPDTAAQQQTARYQELYQNIRSEHDSMRADYNAARQNLDHHDFDSARALCRPWLDRYPANTLFRALQFAIDEEQQQAVSRYVAEVDAAVASQPDLEKKVNILKEAYSRYPSEYFATSLARVTQRRDLVNAQVARAHEFEEHGMFTEAISQWDVVRAIYPFYPGLDVEVDRVARRQREKQRQEEKTRWVSRIEDALGQSDYEGALDLVEKALAQFPEDPELLALRRTSQQQSERAREVSQRIEHARQLIEQGQLSEAVAILREARELDDRNVHARSALVEALVAQARTALDGNDWRRADDLSQEALSLEASNIPARSLRTHVLDRKREEFVGQCLARARELQASGDPMAALVEVDAGLASGDDPALRRLKETLHNEIILVRSRQARQQAIDAANDLRRLAETEYAPDRLKQIASEARDLHDRHPDIEELDSIRRDVETMYQIAYSPPPETEQPPAPPPPPPRPSPTKDFMGGVRDRLVTVWRAFLDLPWRFWLDRGRAAIGALPLWAKAAGAAVLVIALVAPIAYRMLSVTGGRPATVNVKLDVSPADASVTVDEKPVTVGQTLSLPPGKHRVSASAEGYDPLSVEIDVSPTQTAPFPVALTPQRLAVTIESTMSAAKLTFGDEPEATLEGVWRREGLPTGVHRMKIRDARGAGADLELDFKPGAEPVLSPLTAKDVQVVLLASFRGKATLYASFAPVAASWNGAPVGHVENGGLRLNDMKPGPNALSLGEGGASRDLRFDLAAGPELHAWIIEDRSTGDIRISANEPDFKVYIGEIEQPAIRAGRSAVLVRNLKPGDYSVRIVKEGHRVEPPSQMGHVTRGGQVSLEFKLVTLPATLRGAGLPPDTMILFRNETITVPREGRFERGNIPVGSYDILIRRRGYLDRRFVRQFDRGKTIEIGPGDMPQPIMGRLQIPPVSPANATIKIQCQKTEVQECPPLREVAASPSRELSLLYGDYTFTYEAPGYEPEVRNASVGDALVTPGAVTLRRRR